MSSVFKGNLAVVIPAFNEAGSISAVLRGVQGIATPIVVDDGSTDSTDLVARREGALVVRHVSNQGYDEALTTGLLKAIEMNFKYAITVDADGQHNSSSIELFAKELVSGVDMVLGVRKRHQRFAEGIFGFFSSLLWGIKDPLCGLKGYNLEVLSRLPITKCESIGTQFAIRYARLGLRFKNINIVTSPRLGMSRFGSGWRPNYKILKAFFFALFLYR